MYLKTIFSLLLTLFTLSLNNIRANMGPQGFEMYPNHFFVETGTFSGDGIRFALRAGFPQIHSIEIDSRMAQQAKHTFRKNRNVHIWKGDSGIILFDVIREMDKPITFWLDGHCGVARTDGGKNTPLIEELEQIKKHPIKTHTIIIDDMHCCDNILFDYLSKDDIIKKIKEINPNYTISYIPGGNQGEYPTNIMVATVTHK